MNDLRSAKEVRKQLGGISDVTLWRRCRDPRLGFPKPRKILGRLYFVADEVDAWIRAQSEAAGGVGSGNVSGLSRQVKIRMKEWMRAKLADEAKRNKHSLHDEIVHRLERSFK